jgi:hypothetical protein
MWLMFIVGSVDVDIYIGLSILEAVFVSYLLLIDIATDFKHPTWVKVKKRHVFGCEL